MLDKRKKYLQIALNSTIEDARDILSIIPLDERIIIEAGTPFIKEYGVQGIRLIKDFWTNRIFATDFSFDSAIGVLSSSLTNSYKIIKKQKIIREGRIGQLNRGQNKFFYQPYIVADTKCMDRGLREVEIAQKGGASAATVLGSAPIETINAFIKKCEELGLDSMIDMMNVDYPLKIIRDLKQIPKVVILHRGVDEEDYNREKQLPYHEIQRIKGSYDIMLSVAGGDTIQEVQRAIFNDVDIVVVWRAFYRSSKETLELAETFLREIR